MPAKTAYICTDCGAKSAKWAGRCAVCGEFNTLLEEAVSATPVKASGGPRREPVALPLSEIEAKPDERTATGIAELDRVLSGGLVRGSLTLLGGEPGIGKSTLLLDVCRAMASGGRTCLYTSGEESARQIKLRAVRMDIDTDGILLMSETDVEAIIRAAEKAAPDLLIIDSVQTARLSSLQTASGGVAQVREAAARFMRLSKDNGITTVLVGHVTKDGELAGPRILEHIVDTVLHFEGERRAGYRVLRAVKNRFGATGEVGVFEMTGKGLFGIKNPSAYMLDGRLSGSPGSCVTASLEGSRPILAEIQALATDSPFNMPRRVTSGLDFNRAAMLTAVMEKRAGLSLSKLDLYINVAGGFRVIEPAADAAVCAAISSSYRDKPIIGDCVVFGEVGLSGELRGVSSAQARVVEAARLGFKSVAIPRVNAKGLKAPGGIEVFGCANIAELIGVV